MSRKRDSFSPARLAKGLTPISNGSSRILILGSFPGTNSLRAGEYYARHGNRFWPVMQAVLGIGADRPYSERWRALRASGVAVWDVLANCERAGSSDNRILTRTAVPNDFRRFFREHPGIRTIFFNGNRAEALFQKLVESRFEPSFSFPTRILLPSTSPANTRFAIDRLVHEWSIVKTAL